MFEVTFWLHFFHGVMFCEIYAQLKPSKILASPVQNPDKWRGPGADRPGKNLFYTLLILKLFAKQIALELLSIHALVFLLKRELLFSSSP